MRLRDYFLGIPVRLRSPLSAQTVANRVNSSAASPFWPFTDGVAGRIWLGHIRLRFRDSFFEYNAKPVLVGRLEDASSGSILTLRYRAPAWAYVFDLFWYSFLGLSLLTLLFADMNPALAASDHAFVSAGFALFAVFPLGLHYYGTRRSDEELTYLLDFLAEQAGATLEQRPGTPNSTIQ